MRQTICFDLDGTLTDPAEGITRSIQYACSRLGLPPLQRHELLFAIGPPIQRTFALLLKTEETQTIQAAVDLYRERYASQGMLEENTVYPDVEAMLLLLNEAGKRLYVATSKPTVYALRILQHFGLDRHFAHIYGSELDGTRANKADLLAHVLENERLSSENVAMVGDRMHDIAGARQNSLHSVGVTYGYGSVEELTQAGAEALCSTPGEVAEHFTGIMSGTK